MNLKEGTRRLALLLGAGGAILCGVLSWTQLQSNFRQRADHLRFERLANSQVVHEARADLQQAVKRFVPIPTDDGPVTVFGPDGKTYNFPEGTDKDAAIRYFKLEGIGTNSAGIDYPVNRDGIKTVHWTESLEVESLKMKDGQTLYSKPAPGGWSYFLIAILPLLGFFIPWGVVRAIGWVGTGFAESPK